MDFVKEHSRLIRCRLLYGVLTFMCLQALPILVLAGITSCDLFHPVTWMLDVITIAVSFRTWVCLVPVLLISLLLASQKSQDLYAPRKFPSSKFELLKSAMNIATLTKIGTYFILSALLCTSYFILNGMEIRTRCSDFENVHCLDVNNFFIIVSGIWSGMFFFLQREIYPKSLEFPIIHESKLVNIRFQAMSILRKSFKKTILPFVYFLPVYFIFSSKIMVLFSHIYNVRIDPTPYDYFDTSILVTLLRSWSFMAMLYYSLKTFHLSLSVHLTEHHTFPWPSLMSALRSFDSPFIRHLAFYDLSLLSKGRRGGLSDVYSLSQPGGIPHNWNTIRYESEKTIKEFQMDIESMLGVQKQTKVDEQVEEDIQIPAKLRRLGGGGKITLFTTESEQDFFGIKAKLEKITNTALFKYVFAPAPDQLLNSILNDSQKVIWAVESITSLASRAIAEDTYGVVVNDISSVVSTVQALRETVEKVIGTGKKKQKPRDWSTCMLNAILDVSRRGLFRIAITYADHMEHLHLSHDMYLVMKNYASFKSA